MNHPEKSKAEQDLRIAQDREKYEGRNGTAEEKAAMEKKHADERAALGTQGGPPDRRKAEADLKTKQDQEIETQNARGANDTERAALVKRHADERAALAGKYPSNY